MWISTPRLLLRFLLLHFNHHHSNWTFWHYGCSMALCTPLQITHRWMTAVKTLFCYYLNLHCSAICKAAGDKYGGLNMQNSVISSYCRIRCGWGINPAQCRRPPHAPHTVLKCSICVNIHAFHHCWRKSGSEPNKKVMWISWVIFFYWACVCVRIFRWQMVRNKTEK